MDSFRVALNVTEMQKTLACALMSLSFSGISEKNIGELSTNESLLSQLIELNMIAIIKYIVFDTYTSLRLSRSTNGR